MIWSHAGRPPSLADSAFSLMSEINPYASPNESPAEAIPDGISRSRQLWRGFLIAPAVAPLLLAGVLFFLVLSFAGENDWSSPMSLIFVPLVILVIGAFLSYVITLIVGMPVIFLLDRKGMLNGWSLSIASVISAFLLALVFMFLAAWFNNAPNRSAPVQDWLRGLGVMTLALGVPALITSVAFWLLALRSGRREAATP